MKKIKPLSNREYEIAKLISKGHKNKKIAEMLDLSEKTTATYLGRIYRKIKLSSQNNVHVLVKTLNRYRLLKGRGEQVDE